MVKGKGEDTTAVMAEVAGLGDELKQLEARLSELQAELNDFLMGVPNMPHESVPVGKDETANVEVSRWGTPTQLRFRGAGSCRYRRGAGPARFRRRGRSPAPLLGAEGPAGAAASCARAVHARHAYRREHGYTEVYVPYLVNADSMRGTGQLPKFEEDLFHVPRTDAEKLYLIPTAEVPVTNMRARRDRAAEALPLKFVAHTPCFRSEAGSYGRDTRGMIRQHQFDKVELVQIVHPEDSYAALEELTRPCRDDPAEAGPAVSRDDPVHRRHGLFRRAKTYDLEVWLPAQNTYREISSCSNFEAFQARRMQARFRNGAGQAGTAAYAERFGSGGGPHAGGGSGELPEADGSVTVPEVLRPYMGGLERLTAA